MGAAAVYLARVLEIQPPSPSSYVALRMSVVVRVKMTARNFFGVRFYNGRPIGLEPRAGARLDVAWTAYALAGNANPWRRGQAGRWST